MPMQPIGAAMMTVGAAVLISTLIIMLDELDMWR